MIIAFAGCYVIRGSEGGGQTGILPERPVNTADVALHPGYKIELVGEGFTFPTAVAFDASNTPYIIESGYSYGEVWQDPKLIKLEEDGKRTVIATGSKNGPWTGVVWHDGAFYIAEGGTLEGGRILKVTMDGTISVLVKDLPTIGDHHTNGPVVTNGYLYFSLGVATNAGVVGPENKDFGWLLRFKDFHDIPCKDVVLSGVNYESDNVLTDDPDDKTSTGAYVPFGTSTTPGQIIKGAVPCTGSIMRVPVGGGTPELVSWGLRNPYGLAAAPDGRLYVTENGYDDRGSRPIWGSGDVLWEVKEGAWYGFPDHSAGKLMQNDEEFKVPGNKAVRSVLQTYPGPPPEPVAILGVHSSSNGFDFSKGAQFGFAGEAFIAQFGDMAPNVGKVLYPVGFKVVRVNTSTGVVRDFATNKGKRNGPASWLEKGGLERPVAATFDGTGSALYVVDFGILKTDGSSHPQARTGVIWKITKQ